MKMDTEKLEIKDLDLQKIPLLLELVKELGESIDVSEVEEGFYLPKVQGNFYYNPDVFMKLHKVDSRGLRKLVIPNLRRLRR